MKFIPMTLALAFVCAAVGTPALADERDRRSEFDNPRWWVDRSSTASAFGRFASRQSESVSDAVGEARAATVDFAAAIAAVEAEKSRLDRIGFPQYSQ